MLYYIMLYTDDFQTNHEKNKNKTRQNNKVK